MIALVAIAVSAVGWLSYRSLEQACCRECWTGSRPIRGLSPTSWNPRSAAARRHCDLSWPGGGSRIDARAFQWRDRSRRSDHRGCSGANGWRAGWPPRCRSGRPIRFGSSASPMAIGKLSGSTVRARTACPHRAGSRAEAGRRRALFPRHDQGLGPNEIYVSPVSFERRERRHRNPMYRHAVRDAGHAAPDGKPFGIVVATADMRPRSNASGRRCEQAKAFIVVDASGNYLVHPDRAREFGSQLGTADRLARKTFRIWRP